MRPIKTRYRLRQIMLAVAVLAGLFAAFGVTLAVAIVILIGVLSAPVILAGPGRRVRAAAWVASLYPLFLLASLYATWLTAWLVLGHRPRYVADAPQRIGPVVEVPCIATFLLLIGIPFSVLLWIVLTVSVLRIRPTGRGSGQEGPEMLAQAMVYPAMWLVVLAIREWDRLGRYFIMDWYID